jgi:tetratricopeptide (TPR) repeat protein
VTAGNGEQERADGVQLLNAGSVQPAEAAFVRAAELGDVEALMLLGGMRKGRLDLDGTEAAFALAEQRGHPEGALMLGSVAEELGDNQAAIAAYRRGDDGGSLGAAFNLALLLHRQGDRDGAMAAWQRADDRGDAEAAYYVGEYATRYEDKLGALIRASTRGEERALARLASFFSASELTDGLDNSAQALELGAELWASGDLKAAQAAFRRLDEGGSADGADALGCVLGGGDLAGTGMEHQAEAVAAFRRADERGSALGALHLGQRLLIRGEQIAEARTTIVRAGSRDTAGCFPSGFGPCSRRSISARAQGRRDSGPRRFIAVRAFAAVRDTRVSTPVRRVGITAVFRRGPLMTTAV